MEWESDGYVISTDRGLVDREVVWAFLTRSYWAPGVTRDEVDRAIDNSLVFGLRAPDGSQAGFARVVTDYARIGWVGDVFVLKAHRSRGLGVWLVRTLIGYPDLQGLPLMLATADAHGLYERFGFRETEPGRMMRRPGAGG